MINNRAIWSAGAGRSLTHPEICPKAGGQIPDRRFVAVNRKLG
jgi:hypothetical protein